MVSVEKAAGTPIRETRRRSRRGISIIATALIALALLLLANLKADLPLEYLKQHYAQPPSKFIEVGGLSIHYRDEGSGPPLVLLHGTGASLHTWEPWSGLLRPDFRIVRMDLPGFGLTGPETKGDYTSAAYVRFLDEFVSKLGLAQFDLAGNSLGGFIAWRYTVAHPDRVRKLILLDAGGYPRSAPPILIFRLTQIPILSSLLARLDPRRLVAKSLRDAYADSSAVTPELIDRYRDLALRPGNRRAFVDRASTREPDRSYEIRGITAPTLILWGSRDALLPVSDAHRFGRDIPHSRVVIYDGVGHVPMEEIADRSAADVRAFLLGDRVTVQ